MSTALPGRTLPAMGMACLVLFLVPRAMPADYEERQGQALLRLQAARGKDGRALVRLSGAVLTLRVQGKQPRQVRLEKPFTSSKSWKVRPLAAVKPETDQAGWERRFYVEPLGKPGDKFTLALPGLRYREGKHPPRKIAWRPIPVRIVAEIGKPSLDDMRPITGPEQVPPAHSWREPLVIVELSLVLLVLVLILLEVLRRKFHRRTVLTPAAWALRELDRLSTLDLTTANEAERFPTLLSDVIRRYLELRFHLRAPRQTTAEFLAAMQEAPQLTADQQALLRTFLERCDLAKFARALLSPSECRALAEQARGFVEQSSGE